MSGLGCVIRLGARNVSIIENAAQASRAMQHRGSVYSELIVEDSLVVFGRHHSSAPYHVSLSHENDLVAVFDGQLLNANALCNRYKLPADIGLARIAMEAFQQEGSEGLCLLDGSFALILYDIRSGMVVMARDRFAHRPLFWACENGLFVCASEAKAVLAAAGIPVQVNQQQLPASMTYGFSLGQDTLFQYVHRVIPGFFYQALPTFEMKPEPFYIPKQPDRCELSREEISGLICDSLNRVTSVFCGSTPDLGILLSGGVDSSLLALHLAEIAGQSGVALTIGAEEWSEDESRAAEHISQSCGLPFLRSSVTPDGSLLEGLREMVYRLEQPTRFDNAWALSMSLKQFRGHASSLITGEGGEMFGDRLFRSARWVQWLSRLPVPFRNTLSAMEPILPGKPGKLARLSRHRDVGDYIAADYYWNLELFPAQQSELVPDHYKLLNKWLEDWEPSSRCTLLDQTLLLPALIERLENIAAAHGMEMVHPFQTNELLELSLAMPYNLKISNGTTKPCLRDIVAARISPQVAYAEKKQLSSPTELWLRRNKEVRDAIMALQSPDSRIREYLSESKIDDYLTRYGASYGADVTVQRAVFRMLGFEMWLDAFCELPQS
jgi:asparagine synthase (glutamine-hydrolysing)